MDDSQQPFTQAIEASSGSMPVLSEPAGNMVETPAAIVASTSSTTIEDMAAAATATQAGMSVDSTPSSQIPTTTSSQTPDSQPVVLVGFAAAQSLAAAKPVPVPYTEPPAESPRAPMTTNLTAAVSGPKRIITQEDFSKMSEDQVKTVMRTPGVMNEDDVRALSVGELKKMGLGRTPSGALGLLSTSYYYCMTDHDALAGFCYSSRMTLHRELENVAKGETHPEQPARVAGIFNKLQCRCVCGLQLDYVAESGTHSQLPA